MSLRLAAHRFGHFGRSLERGGRGLPVGVAMAVAFLLGTKPDDASAGALGGSATSLGLLAALSLVLVVKAWQAHLLLGSLSTVGGLLALVAGAALIWRYSGAAPRPHRLAASGPVAIGRSDAGEGGHAAGEAQVPLPPGVDRQRLLAELRRAFVCLQTAWDQGAPEQLARMTTPDMLEELCAARSAGYGMAQRSEVLTLDVRLIAFEEAGAAQLVCAEFSGLIRESMAAAADPFRELWMLTRPANGAGGWQLAKHQALL